MSNGVPSALEKVVGLSRRDSAVQEIRRAIIQGALQPGEKVTELALASQLGVSRPTLREALNQLAREGWLVQEPYRGMYVAQLSADERLDIARTRHSLDMLAVDAIVADQADRRLAAVDEYWEAFAALDDDADLLTRHDAHMALHRSIWLASENTMLLRLWPVIEAHIAVALAQDQLVRHDPHRDMALHRRLIETLHRGTRDEIEKVFRDHTIGSAEELTSILEARA